MVMLGEYKSVGGNSIVITEIFGDTAFGRFFNQRWRPGFWDIKTGKYDFVGNTDWDIVFPKRSLKAYRCRNKTRGTVDGFEFWWAPGSIRLIESEDDLKWTGVIGNWERIPSMDVEVES